MAFTFGYPITVRRNFGGISIMKKRWLCGRQHLRRRVEQSVVNCGPLCGDGRFLSALRNQVAQNTNLQEPEIIIDFISRCNYTRLFVAGHTPALDRMRAFRILMELQSR